MSEQLNRIEAKVDDLTALVAHLLRLLAEDDDEQPEKTLDGEVQGHERDQSQSL